MDILADIIPGLRFAGRIIPWDTVYTWVKYIGITIDAFLIIGIIITVYKAWSFIPDISPKEKKEKGITMWKADEYRNMWSAIIEKAELSPPDSLAFAIVEADSFVDTIMKDLNLKGEHMADRLEQIDLSQVRTVDNVWKSHRIRNQIVHTPGFIVPESDARRFLTYYSDFLKEIGAL